MIYWDFSTRLLRGTRVDRTWDLLIYVSCGRTGAAGESGLGGRSVVSNWCVDSWKRVFTHSGAVPVAEIALSRAFSH